MTSNKVQIKFDFNAKDVELASNRVLSLTEQIRLLKKELQKGDYSQEQFEILSKKLNETQDRFAATQARSRELFGTLQLIPGPIGEISSKVNGAISLLKVFSSFSLKDLQSQFRGLVSDIKDIFSSLGGLGDASKNVSQAQQKLSDTTRQSADNAALLSSQAIDAGASIQGMEQSTKAATTAQKVLQTQTLGVVTASDRAKLATTLLTEAELAQIPATETNAIAYATKNGIVTKAALIERAQTIATQENTAAQGQNIVAQEQAAAGATTNALANEGLAIAETKAAVAGRILRGVLVSLGIGAIVVLIGMVVGKFMELMDAMSAAKDNTDDLNRSLERQKQLLDDLTAGIDAQVLIDIERAKQAGKSENEIYEIRKKGLQRQLQETRNTTNEIAALEQQARNASGRFAEMSEEKRIEMINKYNEQKQALFNKEIELGRQIELEGEREKTRIVEEGRKKRNKDQKDAGKDANDELKAQLDAAIQLEIDSETTRQDELEKLLNRRLALEKLTGDRLTLARNQNAKKVEEAIQEDKDRADKQIEDAKEFERKIRDIKTLGIADEIERKKVARKNQLDDDLMKLEQDKQFIKKSEEEKAKIRAYYIQVFNMDIAEIEKNNRIKLQEDEIDAYQKKLRLLELQGQGLLKGTQAYFINRKEILATAESQELAQLKIDLDNKKITQEEYEKFVTETKKSYARARIQLSQEELEATGKTISATIDAFANLGNAIASTYDQEAETSERAFNQRKKLQIATAVMSAASGIVQILTQPSTLPSPFDWIVKGVNAAALAVSTAVNIKKIKSTKFESPETEAPQTQPYKVTATRAQGGIVTGPGTSTSDSIPARLSNGEYVVNARATNAFLPLLNAINDQGLRPRFAGGGLVSSTNASMFAAENLTQAIQDSFIDRPVKTYVVGKDMSNQQQFDRTIKSRSII